MSSAETDARQGETPRLLAGLRQTGRPATLAEHLERYGALPPAAIRDGGDPQLVQLIEAAGLLGHGGAGFPTGRKMRTVASSGRSTVVVANGMEGEPSSSKDGLLLGVAPHLVLDGLEVAARAVGARRAHIVVHRGGSSAKTVRAALLERTALRLAVQQGCGGDDVAGPNATWGFGRLDVARAIAEACAAAESDCADAFDEDCDGRADCADDQCVGDASCANEDHDGDGVSNALDCAPLDGGAFAPPGDVSGLRASLIGRETARLRWAVSYASGTGVGHDVASGTIVLLRATGATGQCLTSDEPRGTFLDARPATRDGAWYLVTARNGCGPSAEPAAGCP